MNTSNTKRHHSAKTFSHSNSALGVLSVVLALSCSQFAGAQINRSERPTRSTETETKPKTNETPATPASKASGSNDNVPSYGNPGRSSTNDRNNRTERVETNEPRIPIPTTIRIKKTKESADSENPYGKDARPRYSPYVLFPDVYGCSYPPYPAGDRPPVDFPDSRYPEVTSESRFYSIYVYCDDMIGVSHAEANSVFREKGKRMLAPIPIFRDKTLTGWKNLGAKDYQQDRNLNNSSFRVSESEIADLALDTTIRNIAESWQARDIEPLAKHLLRKSHIAIALNGVYQYSMEAGDFLRLSKSALDSASALPFIPDHLHRKSDTVYVLTGSRPYKDSGGASRANYFSYTLELSGDVYQITQISTAPDRL